MLGLGTYKIVNRGVAIIVDSDGLTRFHLLMPGPFEYVILCAKGTLRMWFRIFRWHEYPGLARCVRCNHKTPYKREARESISDILKCCAVLALRMKRGAMNQECKQLLEAKKNKRQENNLRPRASRMNTALLTSWLQDLWPPEVSSVLF